MRLLLFSFLTLLLFVGCQKKKDNFVKEKDLAVIYNPSEAQALMEKHCYLCHNPSAGENEGRVAPPMVANSITCSGIIIVRSSCFKRCMLAA